MKTFFGSFLEVIPKEDVHDLCGRKYSHKEMPENFSGKFGEIRSKIFRNPKNLPAPTPTTGTNVPFCGRITLAVTGMSSLRVLVHIFFHQTFFCLSSSNLVATSETQPFMLFEANTKKQLTGWSCQNTVQVIICM